LTALRNKRNAPSAVGDLSASTSTVCSLDVDLEHGGSALLRNKTYCGVDHMSLSKMKSSTLHFGTFKRPDEEIFEISARLYECPSEYAYWLGIFDVTHKTWKTMHITLFIPKAAASSIDLAKVILKGEGVEGVKSKLLETGPGSPAILSIDVNKSVEPGRIDAGTEDAA
jgi:hypothetical protein